MSELLFMKPWQRNRIVLVVAIFISVAIINIPTLSTEQALSLIALVMVVFGGYVLFWNSYKGKK